ncbi:helix-turn-helix domain-containing protein [Nonomuraea sp. B12E4]|uniref:TetR/AcrR family transcriptional regulator n=1 Tax=Nonomuraea sp. B12E4 TaxID=3153564 RepID=UPI00325F1E6C
MPTTGPAPQRKMRADARRNYERLLAAAKTAFAEHGVEASLEEIARQAGVANGTLYSHFPTRQALLEELLRDRMQALSETARDLLDHPSADEALTGWARAAMAHATAYRGLATSLMRSIQDETSRLHAACQAVLAGGQRILDRARAAAVVRGDVTAEDVYALINAAAWAGEQTSPEQAERLLSFGLEGMRPPAGG